MYTQVFGRENAADDDLLSECYILPPGNVADKPILIGRWGTGKTGLLLHRNRFLSRSLREIDPDLDRIWYLDETGLPLQSLSQIELLCDGDEHAVKRTLEDLWRTEILRSAGKLLSKMHSFYGNPGGEHWSAVNKMFSKMGRNTVFEMIPAALSALTSQEKSKALSNLLRQVKEIETDSVQRSIQKCLRDIADHDIQPVVCIEPIETPNSEIEDKVELAQLLVTCLVNVFYKNFQPSERQLLTVEISIPWHRYLLDKVGEPQKLFPYVGRLRWTKESLRAFINARIEWEFKRVSRKFNKHQRIDAWSTLFPATIKNINTHMNIPEDSFDYILRHSQYRVRDVLRFCREIIEFEAGARNEKLDDVLLGRRRVIAESSIRESVRRTSKRTANERVLEAERRFTKIREYIELLRGMTVPFSIDELKRRFSRSGAVPEEETIIHVVDLLWNSGFIGLQMKALSNDAVSHMKTSFNSQTLSPTSQSHDGATFYLFDHLEDRGPMDIIKTFDGNRTDEIRPDTAAKLVVHPMMFEFLDIRVVESHPVGV